MTFNILYISISKDIRFYGQLKTIGTTKKQIKGIVQRQALMISAIGIPMGLLLGALTSFGIIPYALGMMYFGDADFEIKVSFSPLVFIGAAIFTLVTVLIASMKPANVAGKVSPIAALRYTETSGKKSQMKNAYGVKLYSMAWQNLFRNKKSTFLVFISMIIGLGLFLGTTGILSSINPENALIESQEADFILSDNQLESESASITDRIATEVAQIEGVQDMRLTYAAVPDAWFPVEYSDAVFGDYIRSLDGVSGLDFSNPAQLEAYTENFSSGVYGIDSAYLEHINKSLEHPIDYGQFEKGEIVLLSNITIASGQPIKIDTQNGQRSFTVADTFLPSDFQLGNGRVRGSAPNLFISLNALKSLSPQVRICRIDFDTNRQNDAFVLQQVKAIKSVSPEIEIVSRYERLEEMSGYIVTIQVLGMGLSAILLLIGVMNFINSMAVSVNTRKHEFAMLESIGMTKKQTTRVLLYEGFYYWGVSFFLIAVLGTPIYILIFSLFKQVASYAVFNYPIAPLLFAAPVVLAVCLIVPVWIYKSDIKSSVVERLREID